MTSINESPGHKTFSDMTNYNYTSPIWINASLAIVLKVRNEDNLVAFVEIISICSVISLRK
jgi:hypothetical protein